MRLSSWSQNACFVHTAIRSAVASNNVGEIQNMDLPFNHFWFRLTFSELQTIPLESLFVRMSLKRLQVFFPTQTLQKLLQCWAGGTWCPRWWLDDVSVPDTLPVVRRGQHGSQAVLEQWNTHSYCTTLYDRIGSPVEPASCYRRVAGSIPLVIHECMNYCCFGRT